MLCSVRGESQLIEPIARLLDPARRSSSPAYRDR
jgi:hypothetical protein